MFRIICCFFPSVSVFAHIWCCGFQLPSVCYSVAILSQVLSSTCKGICLFLLQFTTFNDIHTTMAASSTDSVIKQELSANIDKTLMKSTESRAKVKALKLARDTIAKEKRAAQRVLINETRKTKRLMSKAQKRFYLTQ